MIHRHLAYDAHTPPERLPSAAIVDILERGDLDDWRPIATAVAAEPGGPLAARLLRLLSAYPLYGTSSLWRAWIDRCRARHEGMLRGRRRTDLATLRKRKGLTQAELAKRIGMSQSDLSKFERRGDVRLSTLRTYVAALGGNLLIECCDSDGCVPLEVGADALPARALSARA
ncbi:MAG: helix-turn-helix domain-containing protein [Acidobacteriota bacterium]